ncbi:hypothetical protein ACFPOI_51370 [Nonomuraea angiospora]|uniref:GIY-YIG nuclease family protein n=1 Tax=Nonomuraea angiospora TaxID=46172 RepID=A0ABR9M354_9ACTN|nr:hypothetical protein [Nonomuraea angiospora]MBE1586766.1 hypothetical protein [Nonomuraea angiospora]
MIELQDGPLYKFSEWPNHQVPRLAAGVYTVWREDELLYAGMSGRAMKQEQLVATPGQARAAVGLWTRLKAHASGRRSGDQFSVYVCDRFVVPVLTPHQQAEIGHGHLSLDQLTRDYIHEHLGYRFLICRDGAEASEIERAVRAGSLEAGLPYLNPLKAKGRSD